MVRNIVRVYTRLLKVNIFSIHWDLTVNTATT